jgi:molybdate transport system substrate-binding protein
MVKALGTVRIGVAVRRGGPHPDVSTVAAFRATLVGAQSVAWGDPARGATTGIHFAKVIERLGIAGELASKQRLAADGLDVMRKVGSGEAELGITQKSEILHADPALFAGLLPDELQLATTYTAWVPGDDGTPARAFLAALTVPAARERFRAEGFD